MASDGSSHQDAQGTGIVRMWNPDDLDNNEFLVWGHNNVTITSTTADLADVDGTVIEERLSRIWSVNETGEVGNVSVSFNYSALSGIPLGSNLRLLIDRDNDFSTNDVPPIIGLSSSEIFVFSNVNFQDGDRFTLGNVDASIPLPIELLSFGAEISNSNILIKWTTASEIDNDYFSVERSANAYDWKVIATVNGIGNSNVLNQYEVVDYRPISGRSYYRLKQTDINNQYSISNIVTVEFTPSNRIVVFPNPSFGLFSIVGDFSVQDIKLNNYVGQHLPVFLKAYTAGVILDMSMYPSGIYFMKILKGGSYHTIKLIRN